MNNRRQMQVSQASRNSPFKPNGPWAPIYPEIAHQWYKRSPRTYPILQSLSSSCKGEEKARKKLGWACNPCLRPTGKPEGNAGYHRFPPPHNASV